MNIKDKQVIVLLISVIAIGAMLLATIATDDVIKAIFALLSIVIISGDLYYALR